MLHSVSKQENFKLEIIINNRIVSAILYNISSSIDFLSLLPLDIKLDDYANTEKGILDWMEPVTDEQYNKLN